MNKNNRRSSLRKAPTNEDDTTTTAMRIKRRISFSGKKSVREFVNTEEPKNWNHSYEVSDHLNGEDSSGAGSESGSQANALNGDNKENILLPATNYCERSHIDITLNLQTSVDVTLLPCELSRKQKNSQITTRDSLALSLDEQQRLQDTLLERRIMDKTLDLMSGSLVARMQKSVFHNASGGNSPPGGLSPITEIANSKQAAANYISDSFMDITPLAPAAPSPPATHQPLSNRQLEAEDIEIETFESQRNLLKEEKSKEKSLFMELEEEEVGKRTKNNTQHEIMDITEKENVNPAQKSLFMELEEEAAGQRTKNKTQHEIMDITEKENLNPTQKSLFMELEEEAAGKQTKNKTQHDVDISFSCSLNVSADKELLPPANISFESASSANSTINFKDESVLIPLDMLSGKHISKRINLRQLNEELEAGKIQLFPNGPKTPITDSKTQKKRYWLGQGHEGMETEEEENLNPGARDIRRNIKPRAMLNFSESMAMSPPPMAPVQKETKGKAKDKEKDNEDKRKYRLSQADEIMLDNTNFLAHARLGDETQSRNTSKNSTRRETTYDYSELDLEEPASSQNYHSKPRQTIHQPEDMQADPAISAVKNTNIPPPPRRTLYLNESIDQEVTNEAREAAKAPAYASTRTKRRETLLLQVSMEEEIIQAPQEPEKQNVANTGHDLPLKLSAPLESQTKSRQNVQFEEEMDFSMKEQPDIKQCTTKCRQTLLLAEPIEEEVMRANAKEPSTLYPSYKSRKTITMSEAIEEDKSIFQSKEQSLLKYKALEATQRPKARQTLLMAEPIEEDELATFKPNNQSQEPSRLRPRNTILMAEPILEDFGCNSTKSRQQTLVRSEQLEEMEEELALGQAMPSSKPRHTIHQPEDMQEDLSELPATIPAVTKSLPRRTFHMNESIEQEVVKAKHVIAEIDTITHKACVPASNKTKRRETILMQESMEEDVVSPLKEENIKSRSVLMENEKSKARQTLHMAEPMKVETDLPFKVLALTKTQLKPRQTLVLDEPMEEEKSSTKPTQNTSNLYAYSKSRRTITEPMPIEEDEDSTKLRQSLPLEAPLKPTMRSKGNEQSPKPEALKKNAIPSPYLEEPIREEMSPGATEQTHLFQNSRHRKTIIKAESIEEDEVVPHLKEQSLAKLTRQTLYLGEPIEEEKVHSNLYQPRKTIIKSEPMEEEQPQARQNTSEASYRQQKSRKTLIMAEPIEEDLGPNNLPSSQEEQPRLKSRNTILKAEPILEDLEINKPRSLNYQSPQKTTLQKPDLKVITPLANPRLTSLYRELGSFTPGMSLTEFEDQEEMCKTPLPKARQKQRSIYQPTKMDASGFGTPLSHVGQKRQPRHLTPNLPESKKRHTQLFADSQMEMELEMADVKVWEGANSQLEYLPTLTINQFDETVQPVRDYRAAHTQLAQVSSLEEELEDKPITISDVTNYFRQEKLVEEQRRSSGRESGSSVERTFKSYAATNTKFINLSGDTTIFAGAVGLDEAEENELEPQNQIDNEQISLVSTLAEETVEAEDNEQADRQPEPCQAQITPFVIAGSKASCRKCGNCNRSLNETRLSVDSFVLPQQSLFDFSKSRQRLRRLRQKPRFEEMQKHWQMQSLEMDVNESLEETMVEEKPCQWDKAKLMQKIKRPLSRRNWDIAPARPRRSFFDRLERLLAEQQPNWIFDFQLKVSRQLIFYHRLLTTFRIVVNYNVLNQEDESAIRVCSIAEDNTVAGAPPERWTTFEHYLNFQLSLKMPMNLTDEIGGSDEESFCKFLLRIDQIVVDTKRTFHKLMTVLTATNARLLRQSNCIFVRKTLVKCIEDEPLVRFERINFVVQIGNVEEICFSDVLQPELYLFNEDVQFLPKGIAFLEAFLPNPEQYLKK